MGAEFRALRRSALSASLAVATLLFVVPAGAQTVALDPGQRLEDERQGWLPYAFATDSMGTTIGAAAFSSGIFKQPQSSLFGTAFASSNNSWGIVGAVNNVKLPGTRRLFFDSFLLVGHFSDSRYYIDLDKDPTKPKAGSNESGADDFVTGISNDVQLELTLRYSLPIGNAIDDPVSIYNLNRGLLESGPAGGHKWNPLTSGKTTVITRLFGRYQDLDEASQSDLLFAKTNGVEFEVDYDNTDFPRNPSRGSRQTFTLTRDFGWFDSSNSWTNLELDLSKYFDLGSSGWFRQQVLALNFWTSNTPTWTSDEDNPQLASNRPPPYMGSTLGGFDRLRAFPSGRFNDKSAVYYTSELRLIPDTRPLRDIGILNYFEIDWIQVVPFVEAGRVGPQYNNDLYFDDLKYTAGIDLRLMAFRNVFRVGWARSDEGNQIWAMFGQPFSR
jgi:hypothetical protein